MNTKGNVTVLFLSFLSLFTLRDCNTCQTNKLEGDSLTFKLTKEPFKDNDRFTVIKDNKMKIPKTNKKQSGPWIVKNNVLEFHHVNLSDSGIYKIEVFDADGKEQVSYTEIVCVYAKVPKPRVNITCQNEKIDFRCDVESVKGLSYSWHKNLNEFMKNVLNFSKTIDADDSEYTCTAQNVVHKSTSDPEKAACFKPAMLFGFGFWIMVSILAGGGALVVLIVLVIVRLACKRRKKQRRVPRKSPLQPYTAQFQVCGVAHQCDT